MKVNVFKKFEDFSYFVLTKLKNFGPHNTQQLFKNISSEYRPVHNQREYIINEMISEGSIVYTEDEKLSVN